MSGRALVRLGRAVLVGSCLAAPAHAGQGAPLPFVVEDACPFECCTYGEWIAREPIPIHSTHRAASARVGELEPGETFEAVTGRVIIREAGRVRVSKPHELIRIQSLETGEYLNPHERTTVEPGEGEWNVWFDGKVYQDNGMAWRFGRYEDTRSADEASATLVKKPTREWWVRVHADADRRGWVLMDDVSVDGNDACAY